MRSQNRWIIIVAIFLCILLVRQLYTTESFISLQQLIQRNSIIQNNAVSENAYSKVIGFMYKYPNNSNGIFKTVGQSYFKDPCNYNIQWNSVLPPGKTKPLSPQTVTEANNAFQTWIQCINQKNRVCMQQLTDFNQRFLQSCTLKDDAWKSPKNFANVF